MQKYKAWLGQVTTGHAFMILLPTLMAWGSGQIGWRVAVVGLAASIVGLLWPENAALKTEVATLVTQAERVYDAAQGNATDTATATATTASTIARILGGLAIAVMLGFGLAACQQSAETAVAEIEVGLTATEAAAYRYASLPHCPGPALCSDPAVTARLKQLDQVAYAAVKAARASGSAADVTSANAAIAALTAAVPLLTATAGAN